MIYCQHCGARVEPTPFCPYCGHRLREGDGEVLPVKKKARWRLLGCAWLPALFLITLALLAGVLALGAAGVYQGLREREALQRSMAQEHFNRGMEYLQNEQYEMAIAEFERALRLYPQYTEAREKLREVEAHLQAQATPTSEVQNRAADLFYQQAQEAFQAGDWEMAILKLQQLRVLDPTYQTDQVEELLFTALTNQGLQLVKEDRMEEALNFFDQALELRPDDVDVLAQRKMAALYLTGRSYWEADWASVIANFSELYSINPLYKDVRERLWEAYVSYGDMLAKEQDWCAAEKQYAQAIKVRFEQAVEDKRINANWHCLITPVTPVVSATTAITETPSAGGLPLGQLALSVYHPATGSYDLFVVQATEHKWVRIASQAGQPSFSPDGRRLAYRAVISDAPGIYVTDLGSQETYLVITDDLAIQPTWSPDGTRLAFARLTRGGQDGVIYVIPADGSVPPEELTRGRWPVWGPGGWLAYNACAGEENACGIYVRSEEGKTVRLTASERDVPLSWSPDGAWLAYMSDVGRSWNIYIVAVPGGFVQQLTRNLAQDGLPVWSPDGQYLAFISDRDGSWGLYLMRPDGSEQQKVMDLGALSPRWMEERLAWGP